MTCPARSAARKCLAASGANAYWYLCTTADPKSEVLPTRKELRQSSGNKLISGGCWPCPGAGHGSDLPFIFDTGDVHVEDARADLADTVQAFYKDFADTGNPNSWNGFSFTKDGQPAWADADQGGMQFKAKDTVFLADLRKEECDFWDA